MLGLCLHLPWLPSHSSSKPSVGTPLALHTEHASSGIQRLVILLEQVALREREEEYGGTAD